MHGTLAEEDTFHTTLQIPCNCIFQGAVTLSSILWLYLTGSEEVTEIALKLVLKVGKSVINIMPL